MTPQKRAAVMRRLHEDDGIKKQKAKQMAADQRRGDGTPKDHVKTCLVESFHRIHSAVQQNGPGTNRRWIATCSDDDSDELLTFANNLSSRVNELAEYLRTELAK